MQIPITAFIKLIGTRWFDALMDEIEEAEIDIVCGEGCETVQELSMPLTEEDIPIHHLSMREAVGTLRNFATT